MMAEAGGHGRPFRKFGLAVNVGFGVWLTALTATWLASDHPWAAIGRAIFAGLFLWSAYLRWKNPHAYPVWKGRGVVVFPILGAVGVAALWVVAEVSGDAAYRHEAIGFSFYGGALALAGLFIGVGWIRPKNRGRIRALVRGEDHDPSSP